MKLPHLIAALALLVLLKVGYDIAVIPTSPSAAHTKPQPSASSKTDTPQKRPITSAGTTIWSIPSSWPDPLKHAAQAQANPSISFQKVAEQDLEDFRSGGTFAGNITHYLDILPKCRQPQKSHKIYTDDYDENQTSLHSIEWVEEYIAKQCPFIKTLPPGFRDWQGNGLDDSWINIDANIALINSDWLEDYATTNPRLAEDRQHTFVMQPSYSIFKQAQNLILYGHKIEQVEIGLQVFGGYKLAYGDPLDIVVESETYPAITDRFNKRMMDLTATVFYCRHRPNDCAPHGFYSFLNCQYRYICSDSFSVYRLWADRYNISELTFANTFVDSILKRRAELGSRFK